MRLFLPFTARCHVVLLQSRFVFFFGGIQRAREGKYEVRDPRSINPSRFYFRAHSTISKEKIVCPETRVRLENCFILVYVNHSDCVERQQSSNLNRLKGEWSEGARGHDGLIFFLLARFNLPFPFASNAVHAGYDFGQVHFLRFYYLFQAPRQ